MSQFPKRKRWKRWTRKWKKKCFGRVQHSIIQQSETILKLLFFISLYNLNQIMTIWFTWVCLSVTFAQLHCCTQLPGSNFRHPKLWFPVELMPGGKFTLCVLTHSLKDSTPPPASIWCLMFLYSPGIIPADSFTDASMGQRSEPAHRHNYRANSCQRLSLYQWKI